MFSQGYRPGSLAARGFSFETLAALRPGIVYVSLNAFGAQGPWAGRRGFDTLVQTVSGISDEYALDGKPRLLPVSALDYITGYLGAFGAMVALATAGARGRQLPRRAVAGADGPLADVAPSLRRVAGCGSAARTLAGAHRGVEHDVGVAVRTPDAPGAGRAA